MTHPLKVGQRVSYEGMDGLVVRSFSADGKVAYLARSMRSTHTIGAFIALVKPSLTTSERGA